MDEGIDLFSAFGFFLFLYRFIFLARCELVCPLLILTTPKTFVLIYNSSLATAAAAATPLPYVISYKSFFFIHHG
jgi:hypothetical protein